MLNGLSPPASPLLSGPGVGVAPSRGGVPQANSATPAAKPVPLFVNPSYKFDPSVGIEVIEFHDSTGALTNSIPSQRQLAAYRTHQATPPGEQPPAVPGTPALPPTGNA